MRVTVKYELELDDETFYEMEKVLLNNGCKNWKRDLSKDEWIRFVIENYEKTEEYLSCNNNDLEKAYIDMTYDF